MLKFRFLVFLSCIAFSEQGLCICRSYLAHALSIELAAQYYKAAELGPLIKETSSLSLRDLAPRLSPQKRKQLQVLREKLSAADAGSLRFDSDFSLASFSSSSKDAMLVTTSLSLTQEIGASEVGFTNEAAPLLSVIGRSNSFYSSFLVGSLDSADVKNPQNTLTYKSMDHGQTLNWTEKKKSAKGIKERNVSKNAVIVDPYRGIALGVDQFNILNVYQLDFEKSTPEPFLRESTVRDANGESFVYSDKDQPALQPNSFVYDANSETIAIRLFGADQVVRGREAKYYVLQKTAEGLFQVNDEALFFSHEPLPYSFAYLPVADTLAYRDAVGNFFIRHAHRASGEGTALLEISEPRALKRDDATSELDIENLQFPKVVSVPDSEGGSFVILKANGDISVWDSVKGRVKNFQSIKEFNKNEKAEDLPPGIVEGTTLNSTGRLTALWGDNCIKLFDTLQHHELKKLTLPESLHTKISKIFFTPDSSALFIQLKDGSGTLIETTSGEVVENFVPRIADEVALALEPHNLSYRN